MIMLGMWVCGLPFAALVLLFLVLYAVRSQLNKEFVELNRKLDAVKAKQVDNKASFEMLVLLGLLLALPFLTVAELIILGLP